MDFRTILCSVRNNVIRSRISWDLWWVQEGSDERPKNLEAMNRFPDFFRFDAHAHLVASISAAYRTHDKRRDVRSLHTLVEASRSGAEVSPGVADECAKLLGSVEELSKKLATLRNKAIAHTDLTRSYDEVFKAAGITPFQLRFLLEAALTIVNKFEHALGEATTEFYDYPVADLRELLRFLRDNPN